MKICQLMRFSLYFIKITKNLFEFFQFFYYYVVKKYATINLTISIRSRRVKGDVSLMGMLKEFKEFALRGNVVDMAVGVVIGAAFGKIVSSLVTNVIMPPIGYLLGGIDFSNLFIPLSSIPVSTVAEAKELGVPVIAYGEFINSVIDFLIVAFVIFLIIKQMNHFFPKAPAKEVRKCPFCREAIADDATRCPHCTAVIDDAAAAK